jgi:hypothetical protein
MLFCCYCALDVDAALDKITERGRRLVLIDAIYLVCGAESTIISYHFHHE